MDHQHVHPPVGNVEMGHPLGGLYPPMLPAHGQAMNQQQLRTHGSNNWEGDVEMGHPQRVYPPMPTQHGQAMNQQQLGAHRPNGGNDIHTLLVVATVITALTYYVGTNYPGGYWQETKYDQDGKLLYRAGDPIMRNLHRPRYWVYTVVSYVAFVSSMVMTLSLLERLAMNSRHVRWSFAVACSCLVLTFIVSQPRTHISLAFIAWFVVLAILWLIINVRAEHRTRIIQALCCSHHN